MAGLSYVYEPCRRHGRAQLLRRTSLRIKASSCRTLKIILFGGRLVLGPDIQYLVITLFLIFAPILTFCLFVGRYLMEDFPHKAGVAIMVVALFHTCVVLLLLLLTAGRDPGIIPRGEVTKPSGESITEQSNGPVKEKIENGITYKYCITCKMYRPPRASHCSICNNCVQRFDHHCQWVGQCIGQRNYIHFFFFILSAALLSIYIFAMCALRVKMLMADPPHTVWKALQRSPASVILLVLATLITWFAGGLTCFHVYLISTNQTTAEFFRRRRVHDHRPENPYDKGLVQNFREVFCSPIPQSQINFRAMIQHAS